MRCFFFCFFLFFSWHSHSMYEDSNDPTGRTIISSIVKTAATVTAGHYIVKTAANLIAGDQFLSNENKSISTENDKIKRHQCDICTISFTEKHNLTRHIKTVHNRVKRYKCDICPKFFQRNYQLTQHISRMHKIDDQYFDSTQHIDTVHEIDDQYFDNGDWLLNNFDSTVFDINDT